MQEIERNGAYPTAPPHKIPDKRHKNAYQRQEPLGKEQIVNKSRRSSRTSRSHHSKSGYGQFPPHPSYDMQGMYDQSYYYNYYQEYMKNLPPHIKQYYRQYYNWYGYAGGDYEDKSTRSGRSSVNEEMKKSFSSLSLNEQYDRYYGQSPSPYTSGNFRQDYHNGSVYNGYEPSYYPEQDSMRYYQSSELSGVPSVVDDVEPDPQRTTPHTYDGSHFIGKFSMGGHLIQVLPNEPKEGKKAVVQLVDIEKILSLDREYALRIKKMKSFPGPITFNDTHKDVVIRFCSEKITEVTGDNGIVEKDSVILLWEYMLLLVRQNGKVSGADLAALLLEHKKKNGTLTPEEMTTEPVVDVKSENDESLVRQFSNFLCLGRRKEAVDFAVSNRMWGHAMTLSSRMDTLTHTRVLNSFLSSIPPNDVLQTAIQHFSGRKPDITKKYREETYGDWKEHLAVLVSNPTGNVEKDKASIIGLGDSLSANGQLHASHLCYIAAEVEFGTYINKDSKIVLIGSDVNHNFKRFCSEDAFQCTEVFEYAKSLDQNGVLLETFQSYKLIYALRLVECGFQEQAVKYCEVLSAALCSNPRAYKTEFIAQVVELGSKLKYYDAQYQMAEEVSDPVWLQQLYQIYSLILQEQEQKRIEQQNVVEQTSNYHKEEEQSAKPSSTEEVAPVIPMLSNDQEHKVDGGQSTRQNSVEQNLAYKEESMHPPRINNQYQNNAEQAVYNQQQNWQSIQQPPHVEEQVPIIANDPEHMQGQNQAPPFYSIPNQTPSTPPIENQPPLFHIGQNEPPLPPPPVQSQTPPPPPRTPVTEEPTSQKSEKTGDKDNKDSENKSSWFGKIFGGKKSNRAHLPDDTKKTIVYDENKKRWVNLDGDDEPDAPPPPPPSMPISPIMGTSLRAPRGRAYVDSNKSRSVAPVNTPVMQPPLSMPPKIPVPQELPPSQDSTFKQSPELSHHPHQLDAPQRISNGNIGNTMVPGAPPPMFNPAQFSEKPVPSSASQARKGPARRTLRP